MRLLAAIILSLALSLPAAAAAGTPQSFDVTILNKNLGTFTLTSSESAITFTNNGTQSRYVVFTVDQAWGWDSATSAFSAKFPLALSQAYTFEIQPGTTALYFAAASTSGACHGAVLARGN